MKEGDAVQAMTEDAVIKLFNQFSSIPSPTPTIEEVREAAEEKLQEITGYTDSSTLTMPKQWIIDYAVSFQEFLQQKTEK